MRKILPSILLLVISYSVLVSNAAAQVPAPYVPCDKVEDPEFHSLRPYQASPCNQKKEDLAIFCGNDLVVSDSITRHKSQGNCQTLPGGRQERCTFSGTQTKEIAVKLSDAYLPIMGNTELVKNSQSNKEELDDIQKVNEYVSWYLNGVTDRAEYGKTDLTQIIDFSGPLKKLLPLVIQEAQRVKIIERAKEVQHNQIVVCGKNSFGFIGDIFNIGRVTPQECYKGNNSKAQGDVFRLIEKGGAKGWDGDLSWWNNYLDGIIGRLVKLLPAIPEKIITESVLHHWNKRIPPFPWENDPFAKPERQMTSLEYRKYHNEWRGKTCVIVPLLNWLVCFDNILVPNKYADLFPYVPLSSTEDRKGEVEIDKSSVSINGPDIEVSNIRITKSIPADLFLAHMQESVELADLLQKTFVAKGLPETGNVPPATTPEGCHPTNIRSNPGDDLFAGEALAEAKYDWEFSCVFDIPQTPSTPFPIPTPADPSCTKTVNVNFSVVPKTPSADEVWSRLVAGPSAVFKKIAPKIGVDGAITCLDDIPGATKINYDVDGTVTPAELYFPHVGSIYEYFLKGIQTTLRPKGYGEPITSGTNCSNIACGELPDLPTASGSCKLGGISPGVGNIPNSLKQIIEAAAQTYKTPPNLILGIMYGEGLFNPGRLDWTDENVKNWATCVPVPGCSTSGDDNFLGFNGNDWQNIVPHIKADLLKLDPNRTNPSQCNLLDAIYGLAWNLHDSADGGMAFSCFGINLNAPVPSSCTWNDNQYESAIKVHESGYTTACLTKENSCATGGGMAAACPIDDSCETIYRRYQNPSHNACVWDVAHGN